MQQQNSGANFHIVFYGNCGPILLSFWDRTSGQTTDGWRTDVGNRRIFGT